MKETCYALIISGAFFLGIWVMGVVGEAWQVDWELSGFFGVLLIVVALALAAGYETRRKEGSDE